MLPDKAKIVVCSIISLALSFWMAGPRSAIGRAPDSEVRGPGFDARSVNILSFLLLFREGQLSVTGESMCTKYCMVKVVICGKYKNLNKITKI